MFKKKNVIFVLLFINIPSIFSQETEDTFYEIEHRRRHPQLYEKKATLKDAFFIHTTFHYSGDRVLKDGYYEDDCDDDECYKTLSAFFLRTEIGLEFNKKWAASIGTGIDFKQVEPHTIYPLYGTVRYNIVLEDYNTMFADISYGKIWFNNKDFTQGKYLKIGFGGIFFENNYLSVILRFDIHRRTLLILNEKGFRNSISVGLGFSLF